MAAGQCFGGSDSMTLSNFYQASGTNTSAYVSCTQDPTTSTPPNSSTGPGYALLTMGTSPNEDGIAQKTNGGGQINTNGDVGSYSNINMTHGQLNVSGKVIAAGACTGAIVATGAKQCNSPNVPPDPGYAPPAPPSGNGTISACGQKMTFTPGLYSSLSDLTTAMSCNKAKVFDFRPGVYYFDYSGVWRISSGTMVAGADNPLPTKAPSIPGACPSPVAPTTPDLTSGVEFVFGADAQVNVSSSAQVEICARYSPTSPPVAIYGLKSSLGSGAMQVPAQSGCVTTLITSGGCAMFQTDNQSSNIALYIQGVTYAPRAWVDVDLRKSTNQFFNDGIVARAFSIFAPASATPPTPLAAMPAGAPGPARTVIDLTVYVCPGASSCSAGAGRIGLKAKVGFDDPTGIPVAGARQVTVYSWSVQR
jgi:hypothetical protein